MILIVTYDLNSPSRDYAPFFTAIQAQGVWWHYLKNTWLVDTAKTPAQMWEALRHHVETNDRVMIARFDAPYNGWLNKEAWDWIQSRVPNR